jgi:hypothetical protein
MRVCYRLLGIALLVGVAGVTTVRAEDYSLTFVFGPSFEATAKKGAQAAASASRHWFANGKATVELRRAGSLDGQSIEAKTTQDEMEQIFVAAALQARATDPAAFLTSLDAAAQAAALRPGTRLLVAVLNSPPLSSDMEHAVEHLAELCRTGGVRVVVLDLSQPGAKAAPSALEALAKNSGGRWVRHAGDLQSALEAVAKAAKAEPPPAAVAAAAPPASLTPATKVAAMAAEPAAEPARVPATEAEQSEIPVYASFIRTAAAGSTEAAGPMRGMVMAEVPVDGLKFQVDETAATYLARATIFVIVRDSKNAPVWSGQKEMYIHGPLRSLGWRRQGSLFFMREITVPAGEGFAIDAKVQDLLAGTSGRIRTPLRGAQGAPVSLASDALFVRPFKAGADKLDADQLFSYAGEALSPVLDPRFPSGEDLDLQLYLVLYPDVHAAPPEMSLDLSRDGHVVASMPVQYKAKTAGLAPDGKSAPTQDGQSNTLPYLANIKRAQLAAGSYDAIVNIHQGTTAITRKVPFRVMTGVRRAITVSPANAGKQKGTVDGAVVMPEIEPATIDSSGLALAKEEQKRLWDEAAGNAKEYSSHLPNFRCTRETHRFTGLAAKPDPLKESGSFRGELTFEDGRETYRVFEVNGNKADATLGDLNGVRSRGEFGSLLAGVFDKDVDATYKWAGRAMAMGALCQVFEFAVPRSRSNITLTYNTRPAAAAYSGRVFIDEETGMVRRITILGSELPPDFALQAPSFSLEYGMVRIGTEDYLLPLRSVMQIRQLKTVVRNESVFREYRKFEAQSGIKFDLK